MYRDCKEITCERLPLFKNMKQKINIEKLSPSMQKRLVEDINWKKEKIKFVKDLETNPRYKSFLAPYDESSVKCFIESYAGKKQFYLKHGPRYKKNIDKINARFLKEAKEKIREIQQKKLFNMQCLWRANQIDLSQINETADFRYWEKNINNCNFIEPITQQEIDLYCKYLQNPNVQLYQNFLFSWQDYASFKQEDSKLRLSDYPEWYKFYDLLMGTNSLLLLPDERGKQEILERQANKSDIKESEDTAVKPSKHKPILSYSKDDHVERFIKIFENPQLLKYFYSCEKHIERNDDETLRDAIEVLHFSGEKIAMVSHSNWRSAIILTYRKYFLKKIVENMPLVYDNYLSVLKLGIKNEQIN